jgi:hypothetical protein
LQKPGSNESENRDRRVPARRFFHFGRQLFSSRLALKLIAGSARPLLLWSRHASNVFGERRCNQPSGAGLASQWFAGVFPLFAE